MSFLSKIKSKVNNVYRDLLGYPPKELNPINEQNDTRILSDVSPKNDILAAANPNIIDDKVVHRDAMMLQDEEGQLAVDVYQTVDDVVIKAPVAGVSLDDIDITIADGVLTIRGHRQKEDEIMKEDFYLAECYWGHFSRSIVLPKDLQTEKIKAYFKHGILKITIPKEERIKIKTIPINNTITTSK